MENFSELIRHRRSCRDYTSEEIDAEHLRLILRAALYSPTSRNRQAWHFIVVDNPTDIEKLADCKEHGSAFLKNAPIAIVILGNPQENDCWIEDGSIAVTSMQYQAEELGLGSCWIQVRNRGLNSGVAASEIVKGILNIPDEMDVLCILAVGHKQSPLKEKDDDRLKWEQVHIGKY